MYVVNKSELYHHGIKGQKWGVRRYQNKDGSLTTAGRKKYAVYDDSKKERDEAKSGQSKSLDRKKIAKTALAVGGAALLAGGTYAALKNPKSREAIAKAAKKAIPTREGINKVAKKVGPVMKDVGKKTVKEIGESTSRVGKATMDGALMAVGGVYIGRIGRKYADNENDSIATKEHNQFMRDTLTSSVNAAVAEASKNPYVTANYGSSKSGSSAKLDEPPSNKGIDKSSQEYQNLFKDATPDQRSTIKSLAKAGYDVEQIDRYLKQVKHGATFIYSNELYHHGIKGQKWGVRRYQNADGSLTAAGKKKYYRDAAGLDKAKASKQDAARRRSNAFNTAYNYDQFHIGLTKKSRATSKANWKDYDTESKNYNKQKAAYKSAKKEYKENVKNDPELQAHRAAVRKKVAIAAGATALAAVGAYTLHKTGADKKIADSVIQAGRGMSKKAYNKYYDRPIDTKARVVPNIQKQLGTTKGQVPTMPYKYKGLEKNHGRNYKLNTDITYPRYPKSEGHGPISGKKTGNTVEARSLAKGANKVRQQDEFLARTKLKKRKK